MASPSPAPPPPWEPSFDAIEFARVHVNKFASALTVKQHTAAWLDQNSHLIVGLPEDANVLVANRAVEDTVLRRFTADRTRYLEYHKLNLEAIESLRFLSTIRSSAAPDLQAIIDTQMATQGLLVAPPVADTLLLAPRTPATLTAGPQSVANQVLANRAPVAQMVTPQMMSQGPPTNHPRIISPLPSFAPPVASPASVHGDSLGLWSAIDHHELQPRRPTATTGPGSITRVRTARTVSRFSIRRPVINSSSESGDSDVKVNDGALRAKKGRVAFDGDDSPIEEARESDDADDEDESEEDEDGENGNHSGTEEHRSEDEFDISECDTEASLCRDVRRSASTAYMKECGVLITLPKPRSHAEVACCMSECKANTNSDGGYIQGTHGMLEHFKKKHPTFYKENMLEDGHKFIAENCVKWHVDELESRKIALGEVRVPKVGASGEAIHDREIVLRMYDDHDPDWEGLQKDESLLDLEGMQKDDPHLDLVHLKNYPNLVRFNGSWMKIHCELHKNMIFRTIKELQTHMIDAHGQSENLKTSRLHTFLGRFRAASLTEQEVMAVQQSLDPVAAGCAIKSNKRLGSQGLQPKLAKKARLEKGQTPGKSEWKYGSYDSDENLLEIIRRGKVEARGELVGTAANDGAGAQATTAATQSYAQSQQGPTIAGAGVTALQANIPAPGNATSSGSSVPAGKKITFEDGDLAIYE